MSQRVSLVKVWPCDRQGEPAGGSSDWFWHSSGLGSPNRQGPFLLTVRYSIPYWPGAQWASGFREYMIYLSSDIENETRVTKAALQWQGGKGNKANDWLSQGMLKVGRCSAWTWSWCLWGWLNGLFLLCQHILSLLVRILCWIYPARFQINSAKQ